MTLLPTLLEGVYLTQSTTGTDTRGAFSRLYCERALAAALGRRRIVQVNHSRTTAVGAVRGMHLQATPNAEMKFIRCVRGRVWDVAVDLRAGSRTFLQSYAQELSADNELMMIIPEGCAHGFQSLTPESEMLYLQTAFYAPESERGFSCTDPQLNLKWPLPIADISLRDGTHPPLGSGFAGIAA